MTRISYKRLPGGRKRTPKMITAHEVVYCETYPDSITGIIWIVHGENAILHKGWAKTQSLAQKEIKLKLRQMSADILDEVRNTRSFV